MTEYWVFPQPVSTRAKEFQLKSLAVNTTNDNIRLGTSAFTAAGWEGTFYPAGMKPADFLSYYATKFDTVEVDSTFYRTPAVSTVKGWYAKTPPGFLFAAKVPQLITHEKALVECDEDFVSHVVDAIGDDNLVTTTDYPHGDSKYPNSMDLFLGLKLGDSSKKIVVGAIETTTNYIEHPEVVADRIERVARVVGDPTRVIAGVDCGFSTSIGASRVASDIVWAKIESLAEGARLATERLYGS